jgi:hypothetical protein
MVCQVPTGDFAVVDWATAREIGTPTTTDRSAAARSVIRREERMYVRIGFRICFM